MAGDIELDFHGCCARVLGREIRLTQTEFRLLEVLMRNPGVALRRSELLSTIGSSRESPRPRTIDVYMRRLRERLQVNDARPSLIDSIRGVGYAFRNSSETRPVTRPGNTRDAKRCHLCALIDTLPDEDLAFVEHLLEVLLERRPSGAPIRFRAFQQRAGDNRE